MVGIPNRTGRCAICKRMKVKVAVSFPQQNIGLSNLSNSAIFHVQRAQDADSEDTDANISHSKDLFSSTVV